MDISLQSASRFALLAAVLQWSAFCQAQINSYSIDQTVTLASNSFSIDVNDDNTDDYTFEILTLTNAATAARVISLGGSSVMDNSTFGYPDALACGDGVGGPYSGGNAVLGTDVGGGGLFTGIGVKYLGLNINVAGQSHRGWISLEVDAGNDTIVLHEVGFASEMNEGIAAGQTSVQIDEPLCDFVYTVGTQTEIEVAAPTTGNDLPSMAPLFISTYAGEVLLGEDNCTDGLPCTHLAFNSIGADTITTCIEFMETSNWPCPGDTLSCCFTQVWDMATQTWQRTSDLSSVVAVPELKVQVFPVPARERLNVQGAFETVRILDLSGRVLLTSGKSTVIDVSVIPEGLYVIEVTSSTARHSEAIQIVR